LETGQSEDFVGLLARVLGYAGVVRARETRLNADLSFVGSRVDGRKGDVGLPKEEERRGVIKDGLLRDLG
jgi:hypothetical protein